MLESLSAFLLIKSNNGNSSLDGSHLGDEAFSRVSLIGIEDKSISSREASLKQTKGKSGTVPLKHPKKKNVSLSMNVCSK